MRLLNEMTVAGVDYRDNLRATLKEPFLARRKDAPSTWPSPDEMLEFMNGGCGTFALVLHHHTGWPIVYFRCHEDDCGRNKDGELKLGHVALRHPKTGMYVDAYGHRTRKEMEADFGVRLVDPIPATKDGLMKELLVGDRIGPYTEKTWETADKRIRDHWGLYTYNWTESANIANPHIDIVAEVMHGS